MKIDGQEGVLGLGYEFLVFMSLHIHIQSIFFGHKKKSKKFKVTSKMCSVYCTRLGKSSKPGSYKRNVKCNLTFLGLELFHFHGVADVHHAGGQQDEFSILT